MPNMEDYAVRIETFVAIWREKLITDDEFVANITSLAAEARHQMEAPSIPQRQL